MNFSDNYSKSSCSWIERFTQNNNRSKSQKDFFSFCDAVFIYSVKKNILTDRQQHMINVINRLGCENKTFWCWTHGYKKCGQKNVMENIKFNYKIIFEFSLKNKFKNILLMEDDVVIFNNLWDNYEFKKKEITDTLNENKRHPLIFHFGYFPWIIGSMKSKSKYIKKTVISGQVHCVLYNDLAMKRYLMLYNKKIKGSNKNIHKLDWYYNFDGKIKKYCLHPNNLFFQLSDSESEVGRRRDWRFFFRIQKLFTGRTYYQYDPLFVKYWETGYFQIISLILVIVIVLIIISIIVILCYQFLKKINK